MSATIPACDYAEPYNGGNYTAVWCELKQELGPDCDHCRYNPDRLFDFNIGKPQPICRDCAYLGQCRPYRKVHECKNKKVNK